ncbi:hypothetical protein ACFWAM_45805, partial [Rhodococcus jostii]
RTALRTEVSAEFFAAPQRYMLGVDADAFATADDGTTRGWETIIGRMLAIGRDEDGNIPTVNQFPQMSMEPHLAQLRQIATRFAGETNLPIAALGVVQDNPSSAEAMDAADSYLIGEAEWAQDVFGFAWAQTARNAIALRDNLSQPPAELGLLESKWRDAKTPSRAAAADATMKIVTAFPWLAETRVALEQIGWNKATVDRAMADKRTAGLAALIAKLPAAQPAPGPLPPGGTPATPPVDTGAQE